MLTAIIHAMTAVRPQRSESQPPVLPATMPITWKSAESPAPSPAERSGVAPWATRTAAMKAGVHAHMPRSSHEWKT